VVVSFVLAGLGAHVHLLAFTLVAAMPPSSQDSEQ
jgi:hypothetical protein